MSAYDPPAIMHFDPAGGLLGNGGMVGQIDLAEPASGATWAFDALWLSTEAGRILRFDANGDPAGEYVVDDPGPGARFMAPGFDSLWIASPHGLVYRLDPANGAVVATIQVGGELRAVTTGAGFVWVNEFTRNAVVKIDPTTNEVVSETPVARFPHALAVVGSSVWVSDFLDFTNHRDRRRHHPAFANDCPPRPARVVGGRERFALGLALSGGGGC